VRSHHAQKSAAWDLGNVIAWSEIITRQTPFGAATPDTVEVKRKEGRVPGTVASEAQELNGFSC
jgi:hypothetical protein